MKTNIFEKISPENEPNSALKQWSIEQYLICLRLLQEYVEDGISFFLRTKPFIFQKISQAIGSKSPIEVRNMLRRLQRRCLNIKNLINQVQEQMKRAVKDQAQKAGKVTVAVSCHISGKTLFQVRSQEQKEGTRKQSLPFILEQAS